MSAASKREFDVVLVWSLDRFSGEGICKTLQHLNALGASGVDFRSFSEPFIDTTSASGDLLKIHLRLLHDLRAQAHRTACSGRTRARPCSR
jgi:DNA invertase Pin-like site-specific DNA recombinase